MIFPRAFIILSCLVRKSPNHLLECDLNIDYANILHNFGSTLKAYQVKFCRVQVESKSDVGVKKCSVKKVYADRNAAMNKPVEAHSFQSVKKYENEVK